MKEVKAIIQPFMLDKVLLALEQLGDLPGLTLSQVSGWGKTRARNAKDVVDEGAHSFAKKLKLEIVVADALVDTIVETISREAHTGNVGDGKIFVIEVNDVVKIRTGERGAQAL